MPSYDNNNIFAKILRGEIPNDTVLENDHVLAFRDIEPKTPTHILVIPKGSYTSITDFSSNASADEITAFFAAIATITQQENLEDNGFRCIANTGNHGGQEVPHFHMHILGGAPVGPMVSKT